MSTGATVDAEMAKKAYEKRKKKEKE